MLLTFPPKCPPPQNTGFIIVRLEYEKEENPCNVLNRSAGFCKTTVSWDIVPSDNSYRCKVKIVDNEIHSALGNQLFLSFGAQCRSGLPKDFGFGFKLHFRWVHNVERKIGLLFRSSHFWFLVTFGNEVTKILHNLCLHFPRQDGKKNRKKITQLK